MIRNKTLAALTMVFCILSGCDSFKVAGLRSLRLKKLRRR